MSVNDDILNEEILREKLEDTLIELALTKYSANEGSLIIDKNKELQNKAEYVISDDLKKSLYKKVDKKFFVLKIRKLIMRMGMYAKLAASFATALLICLILIFNIKTIRESMVNVLYFSRAEFSEILDEINYRGNSINSNTDIYWKNLYIPKYIPEGYELILFDSRDSEKMMRYINNENYEINFYQRKQINLDIIKEDATVETRTINIQGINIKYLISGNQIKFIWKHDKYELILISNESKEEMIKIVESIIYIK